ncbi:MAG: metallophosphoesterase [Pseudanabaena sp. ELA748]
MARKILIGDVHGALGELKLLLEKVEYHPAKDEVVLLGDLVDRGDDSPGVVKFCRANGIKSVLGNHDDKLVRRWRHVVRKREEPSYRIPMRYSEDQMATVEALSDEDMLWLAALPHYMTFPEVNVVVMHAGMLPSIPLAGQTKEVLTMVRFIDRDGRRMLSLKYPEFKQPDNSVFWASVYDGTADVVIGHSVVSLDGSVGAWEGLSTGRIYGIDTGCAFGGYLSAMVLDTEKPKSREIVQVKALREYCAPHGGNFETDGTEV